MGTVDILSHGKYLCNAYLEPLASLCINKLVFGTHPFTFANIKGLIIFIFI
jgi:hypothetical protein